VGERGGLRRAVPALRALEKLAFALASPRRAVHLKLKVYIDKVAGLSHLEAL
jgi:hypothetical protein